MESLQAWISQSPTSLDVVTPIKARACGALNAVRKGTSRQSASGPRLMTRGAERC